MFHPFLLALAISPTHKTPAELSSADAAEQLLAQMIQEGATEPIADLPETLLSNWWGATAALAVFGGDRN